MFTTSLFSSGEALKLPVSRAGGKVPERFCADLDLRLLFKDVIRNTVRRLQAAGCRLQAAGCRRHQEEHKLSTSSISEAAECVSVETRLSLEAQGRFFMSPEKTVSHHESEELQCFV